MLNDFRIEKGRLPVHLTLIDGDTVSGELFVQASARHRFEMEDAPEVMNASEHFFPLRQASGSTLLIARDSVRVVTVSEDFVVQPDWSIATATPVCVTMEGGTTYCGKFHIEQIAGRTRALDYLNRATDRFLPLYQDDGLVLLNRLRIVFVRQLIDAAT